MWTMVPPEGPPRGPDHRRLLKREIEAYVCVFLGECVLHLLPLRRSNIIFDLGFKRNWAAHWFTCSLNTLMLAHIPNFFRCHSISFDFSNSPFLSVLTFGDQYVQRIHFSPFPQQLRCFITDCKLLHVVTCLSGERRLAMLAIPVASIYKFTTLKCSCSRNDKFFVSVRI